MSVLVLGLAAVSSILLVFLLCAWFAASLARQMAEDHDRANRLIVDSFKEALVAATTMSETTSRAMGDAFAVALTPPIAPVSPEDEGTNRDDMTRQIVEAMDLTDPTDFNVPALFDNGPSVASIADPFDLQAHFGK